MNKSLQERAEQIATKAYLASDLKKNDWRLLKKQIEKALQEVRNEALEEAIDLITRKIRVTAGVDEVKYGHWLQDCIRALKSNGADSPAEGNEKGEK